MTPHSVKIENAPKQRGLFQSIRIKLILAFSLLFLVVLTLINIVSIFGLPFTSYSGRSGYQIEEAFRKLALVADLKKQRILGWKEEILDYAKLASTYDLLQDNVVGLNEVWTVLEQEGIDSDDLWDMLRQEDYYVNLVDILNSVQSSRRIYHKIYVADMYSGVIMASTDPSDTGTSFPVQIFFYYNPGPRREYLSDVIIGPRSGKPSILLGHVITNADDKALSLLVMEINPDAALSPILNTRESLGEGSEAYLVNQDHNLLTSFLTPIPGAPNPKPLDFRIRSAPVILALQEREGAMETSDSRGKSILAAYRFIPMGTSWGWGMIVKIDKTAILASLREDALHSFLIGLIGLLALVIFTVVIVENFTRPIRSLSWTAIRVAKGDLNARALVLPHDEVGTLSTIFNSMIQRIQNWHQELEKQVKSRTAELRQANVDLKREIEERIRVDKELKKYSEKLEEMVEQRTSELRKAQEELVKKEKLAILGLLAGGVGHELRNPLGVINNAVFYLKTIHSEDDFHTKEYLDIIASEVSNAEKIVSDLMDYAGLKHIEKEKVSIPQIVSQILKDYPPSEKIEVLIDFPEHLPDLRAEPSQIYKIIFNVITNACQAMPEGGALAIKGSHENSSLHISIEDSGTGIPEENLAKIFDPLFTTKARGIGLGLSVSKSLVDACGGNIRVASEINKGSVFVINFPLKETINE
ncbi:HAMP domain-containing protein [Candidatus Sumerlaeota bacterium]|nr:HAMP domain-containing protein [Candidatus Sumerlaeota bacterium]